MKKEERKRLEKEIKVNKFGLDSFLLLLLSFPFVFFEGEKGKENF